MSVLVRSPSSTRDCFLEACWAPSVLLVISLGFSLALCLWVFRQAGLGGARTFPIVRALFLLRHLFVFVLGGTGMFNLFSIAYAFQPWLRGRLTQGRRALPWNPWVFGEGDFHLLYRLLMPCIFSSMLSNASCDTSSAGILCSPTARACARARDFGSML